MNSQVNGIPCLSSSFTLPMSLANQKPIKEGDEIPKGHPELDLEISIDTPLLTKDESEEGMFMILKVDDLWPT